MKSARLVRCFYVGVLILAALHLLDIGVRCAWFDEAFTWQMTRFDWSDMLRRLRDDVQPPLYYIVLRLWMCGAGDSIASMRVLSALWFGLLLVSVWLLCRDMRCEKDVPEAEQRYATRVMRYSVLFLVASPLLLRYSQEARMYTQYPAIVMFSSWLGWRAVHAESRIAVWWLSYALAAVCGLYTHYFGLFSACAQLLFIGVRLARKPDAADGLRSRRLLWAGIGAIVVVAAFVPWLPVLRHQATRVAVDYWTPSALAESPLSLALWRDPCVKCLLFCRVEQIGHAEALALFGAVGFAIVVSIVRGGAFGQYIGISVAVPIALIVASSFYLDKDLVAYRWLTAVTSLVWLAIAMAVAACGNGLVRRMLVFCIAFNGLYFSAQLWRDVIAARQGDIRGAAAHIAARLRPGDWVICGSPMLFFPLKYYARPHFTVYQLHGRDQDLPFYRGTAALQSQELITFDEVRPAEHARLWIIEGDREETFVERPNSWEPAQSWSFRQSLYWRGNIIVSLWRAKA